MSFVGHHCPGE